MMDDRFIQRIRSMIYSWFVPLDEYWHPVIPNDWNGKFLTSIPGEKKFTYLIPVYCIKHWEAHAYDHPDKQFESICALSPIDVTDEIKSLATLSRFVVNENPALMTWKFKDNVWNIGKGIIADEHLNPMVLAVCKTIVVNGVARLMGVYLCIDYNVFYKKEYSTPWRSYICNYFIPACKHLVIDDNISGLRGRKNVYKLQVKVMDLSQFVKVPLAPAVHVDLDEVLSELMKTHINVLDRLSQ